MKKIIYLLFCIFLFSSFCSFGKTDSQKIDDISNKLNILDTLQRNKPSMQVFGTEYNQEQEVKVWLQLLNSSGEYVNNGICFTDIYTPDNEELEEKVLMNSLNHDGIYYYDLPSPLKEGVYPVIARCYFTATKVKYYPTSIEINRGTGDTIIPLSYLNTIDGNFLRYKENTPNPRRIDLNYTFSASSLNSCTLVNQNLLNSISISFYKKFDSVVNDDLTLQIYNFTSNNWKTLSNVLLESNAFVLDTNTISLNNITKSGLFSKTKGMKLRTYDTTFTDGADSNLDLDEVYISCNQLSNSIWEDVKGASEIHITHKENKGIGDFFVQTLCSLNDEQSISNGCAIFKNNENYWNYTWGYIYGNITFINSFESDINEIFEYDTTLGQDCTGIIDITKEKDGIIYPFLNNVSLGIGDKQNCRIYIPIVFNETERDFIIHITQDNYMKWEFQRDYDFVNYFKAIINPFCEQNAIDEGLPFEIPLEQDGLKNISALYKDKPFYLGCYRVMDDLYWFDYYYNVSKSVTLTGDYESYLLEAQYYYPEIKESFNIIQGFKTLNKSVECVFNVSVNNITNNIYLSSNNTIIINNSIDSNTTNNKIDNVKGVIDMLGYILLLIFSILLYIFVKENILFDFFNAILSIILIYLFWINDLQIISYLCIALEILIVIRIYNSKENSSLLG